MRAALLPLALLSLLAAAQSWCPPGATWNYRISGYFLGGNAVHTYEGDTLMDGYFAQRIKRSGVFLNYQWSTTPIASPIDGWRYTAMVDSVLLVRREVEPYDWDTLVRFDAIIGDRWWPPWWENTCGNGIMGMFLVVDTGTVILNGIPLRTWTLDFCDEQGLPSGYEINVTERLGMQYGLEIIPWNCLITELGESLVCYSDNELSYNSPSWPYGCTSLVGQEESSVLQKVEVHPNPGTTHFTLSLPPGPHTITLFDATGRMVLQQRTTDARPVIATEALPAGLYRITVRDEQDAVLGATWVKE